MKFRMRKYQIIYNIIGKSENIIVSQQIMNFISRQCSFYLNYNNNMDFLHYQALSGLGFNKIGLYQDCIADPNSQFYLVKGATNIFGLEERQFMSGICFNKICSAQDLQYTMASIESYIQKLPFSIIHVKTPSLIEQTFDVQNIIVIIILSILILLFVLCSTADLVGKIKNISCETKLIEIFSIFTTLRLLESRSERNNERIKTFSGLKTLCLIGIMLTNFSIIAFNAPTTSFYSQAQNGSIFIAFYAVDIWLFVSGFFLSYLLLKQYQKLPSAKIMMLKIISRFLRLWPIYLISLFLNWNIVALLGKGPLWPLLIEYPKKYCQNYSSYIFMISNFFNSKCYNWLWLLELDFQLSFIFVPVLLIYVKYASKAGRLIFYGVQLIFILCSVGVAFFLKQTESRYISDYFFNVQYASLSILPITRCGGFLIGYNIGIMYYNFKRMSQKNNFWLIYKLRKKSNRILLPLIGLIGLVGITYSFTFLSDIALQDYHIFYFTSLHIIVPLLVAFMIIPSLFGYWSPLKKILQGLLCNLISKLSLSLYSAHYMMTLFIVYERQFDLQLSAFTIIYLTFCTILPSFAISIILTTIVEIPVFVCKKIFWKTQRITYFEH